MFKFLLSKSLCLESCPNYLQVSILLKKKLTFAPFFSFLADSGFVTSASNAPTPDSTMGLTSISPKHSGKKLTSQVVHQAWKECYLNQSQHTYVSPFYFFMWLSLSDTVNEADRKAVPPERLLKLITNLHLKYELWTFSCRYIVIKNGGRITAVKIWKKLSKGWMGCAGCRRDCGRGPF